MKTTACFKASRGAKSEQVYPYGKKSMTGTAHLTDYENWPTEIWLQRWRSRKNVRIFQKGLLKGKVRLNWNLIVTELPSYEMIHHHQPSYHHQLCFHSRHQPAYLYDSMPKLDEQTFTLLRDFTRVSSGFALLRGGILHLPEIKHMSRLQPKLAWLL